MKLTIVADDKAVGIDGEFLSPLEIPQLDASIHAVQWYGEYGEIEFKTARVDGVLIKPQNQIITDIAPFQFAIDVWTVAKSCGSEMPVTEV